MQKRLQADGFSVANAFNYESPIHDLIKSRFQKGDFPPDLKILLFAAELFDHLHSHSPLSEIIIFDRYVASLLAYGLMENLSSDWIKNVAAPLPTAHVTVYIDITAEIYKQRIGSSGEVSPYSSEKLSNVHNNYLELMNSTDLFIDGTDKEDDIGEIIFQKVLSTMSSCGLKNG